MRHRWTLLGFAAAVINFDTAWRASRGEMMTALPPWLSVLIGALCVGSAALDLYAHGQERRLQREDSDRRERRAQGGE